MADKYSTIQQHQPLRVPQGWDKQEKALIVQLDEIFDDIYRRFGRIRIEDLSKGFREDVEEMQEGIENAVTRTELTTTEEEIKAYAAQYTDGKLVSYSTTSQTATAISTAITSALGDYSTTSQTATQISTAITSALGNYSTTSQTATQISTAITNALVGYSTTSQTATQISTAITSALGNYSTTSQTATQISTAITSALGNYSTTSQTATAISTAITSALGDYSTTSQTASAISAAVADCYGKISSITITSNGVDVSGNKHINLDINTSNYVHINSNGIEMKGTRVSINGNDMWARDDIIIMNTNSSETWRRTVADIESHMSGKHDWVLVRPYYNAQINYSYRKTYRASSSVDTVQMIQDASEVLSFGTGASWYQYTLKGHLKRSSSETSSSGANFTVQLSNSSSMSSPVQFTGQVNTTSTNERSFEFTTGHITNSNLCAEGALIYMKMTCNYTYSNIYDLELICTCDATTSKVPCTVYYYP